MNHFPLSLWELHFHHFEFLTGKKIFTGVVVYRWQIFAGVAVYRRKFVAGIVVYRWQILCPVLLFTGDTAAAGDVPTPTNFSLVFWIIWFLLACFNPHHQLAITCWWKDN
jgi:hypothetical protein